jgi:hypothetical protein
MATRFLFVIAVAVVLTSGAASAAPLTSVSYTVTGGTFNGAFSSGPITGGSILYTLSVPTSTPFYTYVPGIWNIVLKGPSGTFKVTASAPAAVFAQPGFVFVPYSITNTLNGPTSNGNLSPPGWGNWFFFAGTGYVNCLGNGPVYAPGTFCQTLTPNRPYIHRFTVGNEVRTFVPEPATSTLVGLGLVLMAFVGGSRGAAARARRTRRS